MARLQTEVGETEAALREERLHSAESYEARIADLQEQVPPMAHCMPRMQCELLRVPQRRRRKMAYGTASWSGMGQDTLVTGQSHESNI